MVWGHRDKPSDIVAHFDGTGKDFFPVTSLSSPESVTSLAQMERMGQLYIKLSGISCVWNMEYYKISVYLDEKQWVLLYYKHLKK